MPRGQTDLPARAILALALFGALGIAVVGAGTGVTAQAPATPSVATPDAAASQALPQSSYDVIRLQQNGTVFPYVVWVDWTPILVTTPDGGAWAFFTAQARTGDGLATRRLYGARFDPTAGVWLPASALPGGQIQFGPTAVVDSAGVVHLVFSDRASDAPDAFSTLLYTRSTPEGGWETPLAVAPDPNAGHQMMPALAIDANDGLHLLWRDQRNVSAEARAALVANADLLASDLVDGAWTNPVQVNRRPSPDVNAGWPFLAVEGDRLVALWSTYQGTTTAEMRSATGVEWSSRPLTDPAGWSEPTMLLDGAGGEAGGRSLDLIADPLGRDGAVLVYGRLGRRTNDLFVRRLERGATAWGEDTPLGTGDRGYLPSLAAGADGRTVLVFNSGQNRDVEVGGWVVAADGSPSGPPVLLTPGEDGEHGRASLALAADGQAWILYMHSASGSANVTEMRVLRGARLGA